MATNEVGPVSESLQAQLVEMMGETTHDPYKWVMYSFNWGAGELEGYDGPDEWQKKFLQELGDALKKGKLTFTEAIQLAAASGHGVGKSSLVSWLILWALSTREDTKGIVTANTETQLKTKTWAELAKWYRLCIIKHWFNFTATAIYSNIPGHDKTWRVDMLPWSENKTESFAGMHNKGSRILIIFDEASAIPDVIWEVTEGALTDEETEIIWAVFGNPTRNTGRFKDCFNKFRHRWITTQVDSRTAKMTNKEQINRWIQDYGEDSDFVRVRVRGEFPNTSDRQFIPISLVEKARGKHLGEQQFNFAAKIITLDNAWTGGDETVIGMRQGLMFKILAKYPRNDNDMDIAARLASFEDQEKADAVFIDLGWGTGVFSAGKQMGRNWILVAFGGASPDPGFLNLRAFMWNETKKWLSEGGAIPNDPVLVADLTGPEYGVVPTGPNAGKTFLESKEDMKKRGLASPNRADSLALTFAMPIRAKGQRDGMGQRKPEMANVDYDIFA